MKMNMVEMLFILFVVLLVFGPKKLPEISRKIGRALGEFRSMTDGVKQQLEAETRKLGIDSSVAFQSQVRLRDTPAVADWKPALFSLTEGGTPPAEPVARTPLTTKAEAAISAILADVLAHPARTDAAAAGLPNLTSTTEPKIGNV